MKKILSLLLVLMTTGLAWGQQGGKLSRTLSWPADGGAAPRVGGQPSPEGGWPGYTELLELDRGYAPLLGASLQNVREEAVDPASLGGLPLGELPEEWRWEAVVLNHRGQAALELRLLPYRLDKASGTARRLLSFELAYTLGAPAAASGKAFAGQSVLASGNWRRVKVEQDGMYRLTNQQLASMGFSDPGQVRVFGFGGVLSRVVDDNSPDDLPQVPVAYDEAGLYFFAQGPHQWEYSAGDQMMQRLTNDYADHAYYYLAEGVGPRLEVAEQSPPTGQPARTTSRFVALEHHEAQDTNVLLSGQQWFGEYLGGVRRQLSLGFDLPNLAADEQAVVKVAAIVRSNPASTISVAVAGTSRNITAGAVNYSYTADFARAGSVRFGIAQPDADRLEVDLAFNMATPSAEAWLDYVCLNAQRELVLVGNSMVFHHHAPLAAEALNRFEFAGGLAAQSQVWDVTDQHQARRMNLSITGAQGAFSVLTGGEPRRFVAFNPGALPSPTVEGADLGPVANQDLHGLPQCDMLVVTHPDFLSPAEELADFHRTRDGMVVHVATTEQIYHEFGSGQPDAAAIRNFARMFYTRGASQGRPLRYLLLMGDGSYDNKNLSVGAAGNSNFVPTFQSEESLSPVRSFGTDDFFAYMDEGEYVNLGALDLGVGRYPVRTVAEAQGINQKVFAYASAEAQGDWRNVMAFLADDADEDELFHTVDADRLAVKVDTLYANVNIDKIYMINYPQASTSGGQSYPEVELAIANRLRKGCLVFNYTGHGNERQLTDEAVIDLEAIESWANSPRLPIFVTATCEFSRFDDFRRTSAGERVILKPDGGAVAMFTTTRLVYSSPNYRLNDEFFNHIFDQDEQGRPLRMGDLMRLTKNGAGSNQTNNRNFALLGDPALLPAYPRAPVLARTATINGKEAATQGDTLSAFRKITIAGELLDDQGNLREDFDGFIYPTVFDKATQVQSLPNDGARILSFEVRSNIIYKGKASVQKGRFSFSFVVPKDIDYRLGTGRVSYYFHDQEQDGAGYFEQIVVGGSDTLAPQDREGPEIRLFLNDERFVSGGTTGPSPTLLAFLTDQNGINTVGSGIGHDITATLNQDNAESFSLNEFYQAELDSYQSGKLEFGLSGIPEGPNQLSLKAWDVFNNSSTATIDFVVAESAEMALARIFNYPNPFTASTAFYFEHNQTAPFEVVVEIFTVSGRLAKTLRAEVNPTGFQGGPIAWDGLDDFGDPLGRGAYIYRLRVRNSSGQVAEALEKLVILR